MSTLIPSVYITNNFENLTKYFDGGTTANSNVFDAIPNTSDGILITPKNNIYLESFEMSYNTDKADRDSLILKIIDTDGQFEQKLIGFKLDSYKKATSEAVSNARNARNKLLEGTRPTLNADFTKISTFATRLGQIYVAFGSGENFSDWSEPKVFTLASTQVDIDGKGLRRYTLGFTPSYYSLFRPKLIFNLERPNPESEFFYTKNIENVIGKLKVSNENYDTLSKVIYGLLKNYIASITGADENNIIGIIPELNIKNQSLIASTDLKTPSTKILDALGIKLTNDANIIASISNNQKTGTYTKPTPTADSEQELLTKGVKGDWYYILSSEKPNNITELNPSFPNFYTPINNIGLYIRSLFKKSSLGNMTIIEENDCRMLKFFKNQKLINNPTDKCIVFGPEDMIYTWLYRSMAPIEESANIEALLDSLVGLDVGKLNPELLKLENAPNKNTVSVSSLFKESVFLRDKNYSNFLNDWLSRKRTGSNFKEKFSLTELALNDTNQISKEVAEGLQHDRIRLLFDKLMIPIFTHNLKNSNVLEIQLLNSENYLQGLNISVLNNFNRFFLGQVASNLDLINVKNQVDIQSILGETNRIISTVFDGDPEIRAAIDEIFQKSQNLGRAINQPVAGATPTLFAPGVNDTYPSQAPFVGLQNLNPKTSYEKFKIILERIILSEFGRWTSEELAELRSTGNSIDFLGNVIYEKSYSNLKSEKAYSMFSTEYSTLAYPGERTSLEIREKIANLLKNPKLKKYFAFSRDIFAENLGGVNLDNFFIYNAIRILAYDHEPPYPEGSYTGFYPSNRKDVRLDYLESFIRGYAQEDNLMGGNYGPTQKTFKKLVDDEYQLSLKLFQYATVISYLFKKDPTDPKGLRFVPRSFGLGEDEIISDLFTALTSQSWKISIKTLPFFWLSNQRLMALKPCFLFSKKTSLIGNELKNSMDFFTGMYNITSFKHVINTKEAYSEFILIKRSFNSSLS